MGDTSAPCKAGYYMTNSGCQQCGENTFSGPGASSCTSCPDGKVSAAGSKSATDCHHDKVPYLLNQSMITLMFMFQKLDLFTFLANYNTSMG